MQFFLEGEKRSEELLRSEFFRERERVGRKGLKGLTIKFLGALFIERSTALMMDARCELLFRLDFISNSGLLASMIKWRGESLKS